MIVFNIFLYKPRPRTPLRMIDALDSKTFS